MRQVVLLVDDDAWVLRTLARRLRDYPFTIYTARTAEEAIHIVKAHTVSAIVADELMPGMNGTMLLLWIAGIFPHIQRFMLTGLDSDYVNSRITNRGVVSRVFEKPCDVSMLVHAISASLHGKSLANADTRRPKEFEQ